MHICQKRTGKTKLRNSSLINDVVNAAVLKVSKYKIISLTLNINIPGQNLMDIFSSPVSFFGFRTQVGIIFVYNHMQTVNCKFLN